MMRGWNRRWYAWLLCLAVPAGVAGTPCTLKGIVEIPVTMQGLQPIVPVKLNGLDARLILDSGAFWSYLAPAVVRELKLAPRVAPFGVRMGGVGGTEQLSVVRIEDFEVAKAHLKHMDFTVGANGMGEGLAGLLGQNVLRAGDVEYDLANGVARIVQPVGCGDRSLAYWARGEAVSVIDIERQNVVSSHVIGTAVLNGATLRVAFDTGASTSLLTRAAAERAGVKLDGPDVVPGGLSSGIGRRSVRTWIAPVERFRIGEEEIRRTHLRIGEFTLEDEDMLIGADFFLSHHLYVATSQHKLYFTYLGGPVFNLTAFPAGAMPPSASMDAIGSDSPAAATPSDAAGFSRRGAAHEARQEYAKALEDLNRACELAPEEASYRYRRGLVQLELEHADLALADFDAALKLRPEDVEARMARATLRLKAKDIAGALTDLDAADAAAPREADARLRLAGFYDSLGRLPAALTQYDEWLAAHGADRSRVNALNGRCWVLARLNQNLEQALKDCNAAHDLNAGAAPILDSRGLVYLRRGQWEKSIADYDAALRITPNLAWSLYGRGIAKLRQGKTAEGQADLAAATAARAAIAEEAKQYGIAP